jgi:signal peptidase II
MSATKTDLMARTRDWWAEARANPYFRYGLAAAFIIAALDRLTKYWIVNIVELPAKGHIEISGIFDLSYVENTGASFGMLAGGMASRILLSLISTGVAVGLTIWLGQLRRPVAVTGVAFIIGGALGNLYDRLAYGYVVDFLDFSGFAFPWVFNIADTAINVGIIFLLLDAWQTRDRPAKAPPSKKTE